MFDGNVPSHNLNFPVLPTVAVPRVLVPVEEVPKSMVPLTVVVAIPKLQTLVFPTKLIAPP